MDQLTSLEKALLQEFKSLAAISETLVSASQNTDQQLLKYTEHCSGEIARLASRQTALEERLATVTEALNRQTASANALIDSVNSLMSAQNRSRG